jgi:hypothetical protein
MVTDLAPPAIATGNGSPLARRWSLVLSWVSHIIWRRGLALIWVLRRRAALPFMRTRQTVLLLLLLLLVMVRVRMRVRMGGHVGSRLSRRGRRQRSVELRGWSVRSIVERR